MTRFAASIGYDLAVIALVVLIATIAGIYAPVAVDAIFSISGLG